MSTFSKEYATALFSLATDLNKIEDFREELIKIKEIFEENPQYIKLLNTPALNINERVKLVDEAFHDADEYVVNFIKILTEKKSLNELTNCVDYYLKEYDKLNNIERVTAITAVSLNNELLDKLKLKLEKMLSKTVFITNEVDKTILGGVLIKFQNSQIDGSIKGRLKELESQIFGKVV